MIELNKIYNESCLDTMSRMPNKFVDLVITSPPYNMRLGVQNGKYIKKQQPNLTKYQLFEDAMPIKEFYKFHKQVMAELLRVSKIVCYNFQIVTGSKEAFFKIIGDFSEDIKDIIIWLKHNARPTTNNKMLINSYEMILILEDDKQRGRVIQNAKFKRGQMKNIIKINISKGLSNIHRAMFPEQLVIELINAFSDERAVVYDPFMGLGTTGLVAVKTNRYYIGSEIVEKYCKIAEMRINGGIGLFYNELKEINNTIDL